MWGKEKYGDGNCVNCGYLGKKSTAGFDEICFTASAEDRTTGQLAYHSTLQGGLTSLNTVPWCYVGKANLKDEVDQFGSSQTGASRIFSVITKDRHCPSWYVWREFSSPKDQWEESVMLAMEQRREKFEQQMEQDRKEFEQKLENDRKNFEMRLDGINRIERKRTDKIMIWLTVAAIIFALAEVTAALMGITADSWILELFR